MSQIVFYHDGFQISYPQLEKMISEKKKKTLTKIPPKLLNHIFRLVQDEKSCGAISMTCKSLYLKFGERFRCDIARIKRVNETCTKFSKILSEYLYNNEMKKDKKQLASVAHKSVAKSNDFDKDTGFWIMSLPYIWIPGNTHEECKRMYIVDPGTSYIVAYDKNNKLVRYPYLVRDLNKEPEKAQNMYEPGETFCLIPVPKNKDCGMVRNHFLVNTYGYTIEHTVKDDELVFSWKFSWKKLRTDLEKAGFLHGKKRSLTIRFEGADIQMNDKAIDDSRHLDVIYLFADRSHGFKGDTLWITLPSKFADARDKPPCGVKSQIKAVFGERKKIETYHNIYHVRDEFDLSNDEITHIHKECIIDLYDEMYDAYDEIEDGFNLIIREKEYNYWGAYKNVKNKAIFIAEDYNLSEDDSKLLFELGKKMEGMAAVMWDIHHVLETIPDVTLNSKSKNKISKMQFEIDIPFGANTWDTFKIIKTAHINYLYITDKITKHPLRHTSKV